LAESARITGTGGWTLLLNSRPVYDPLAAITLAKMLDLRLLQAAGDGRECIACIAADQRTVPITKLVSPPVSQRIPQNVLTFSLEHYGSK